MNGQLPAWSSGLRVDPNRAARTPRADIRGPVSVSQSVPYVPLSRCAAAPTMPRVMRIGGEHAAAAYLQRRRDTAALRTAARQHDNQGALASLRAEAMQVPDKVHHPLQKPVENLISRNPYDESMVAECKTAGKDCSFPAVLLGSPKSPPIWGTQHGFLSDDRRAS